MAFSDPSEQVLKPLQEAAQPSGRCTGEVINVGSVDGESLQDRFLRFRKERQREKALARRSAKVAAANGGDVRDLDRLRQRFVDACRSYLGVPYGRKYHEDPADPDHDAPLFLDCCALVRRGVKDLQEDFGFSIGRWNQAYQFETLPVEVSFEQLRPGDLIFVEGKYYEKNRRPQHLDIVHVEIFIGGETGEATIGSRWSRSNPSEEKVRGVQIHPSYRYSSKNYEIIKYHFRSLDTWLQGVCKSKSFSDSVCPTTLPQGLKSVFDACDEEDASDNEQLHEAGPFAPNPWREAPVFYVGEGNNWKALAQVLEARGWRRLPFDWSSTHRFDLKWCECRGQIDYRRHLDGQLVNHIPNNDVITAKTRLLETLREHENSTGEKFSWLPSSFLSERPSDCLAALAQADSESAATWILKPSRGLGGKGIEIVRGSASLRDRLFPTEGRCATPTEGWVVQRYIDRPLLLQGCKFDIRAYCLIARTEPHLWLFHPGYCKVALEPYCMPEDFGDELDERARFAHLTNACVQRTHPDYKSSRRGQHIWSLAQAEEHLVSTGRSQQLKGTFWPKIHQDMKRVISHLFRASKGMLERKPGYFDLLGLDFMLDESMQLHLLEVNSNPAMFFDSSPVLEELVPRLLGSAIDLVLTAQHPEKVDNGEVPSAPEQYELVIDESSNFCFGC